ncbi:MAG: ATP-dependent 6-phosphofructokinase [Candidatus Aureabacteria bacterium]|nr:ATP-dependent 6-phosphofructokinase [Candidatus Auribacterota bacterium]
MKTIGILTGGGDCPGLNAVIAGVVRRATVEGYRVLGIRHGWRGMLECDRVELSMKDILGIVCQGGTILRTSRTNPCESDDQIRLVMDNFKKMGLHALVAVGGDDTLGAAKRLSEAGLPAVGVPKTIDNDLSGTDRTFGFDTAVNTAMEACDRLKTTAESHERVMVVEIMGRHAGWITIWAGLAGAASYILIPEVKADLDDLCRVLRERHEHYADFSIVAVAEGAELGGSVALQTEERDAFGHVRLGGIGERLAWEIEKRTGYETRCVVLGHLQRGGSPTALDRFIGLRFGVHAVGLIMQGAFGRMVSLRGNEVVSVPLADAVAKLRTVPRELYDEARMFFI